MMITGVIETLQYVVCIVFFGRDFHYKADTCINEMLAC